MYVLHVQNKISLCHSVCFFLSPHVPLSLSVCLSLPFPPPLPGHPSAHVLSYECLVLLCTVLLDAEMSALINHSLVKPVLNIKPQNLACFSHDRIIICFVVFIVVVWFLWVKYLCWWHWFDETAWCDQPQWQDKRENPFCTYALCLWRIQ